MICEHETRLLMRSQPSSFLNSSNRQEREFLQTVELELDFLLHGIQKLSFRNRVIME